MDITSFQSKSLCHFGWIDHRVQAKTLKATTDPAVIFFESPPGQEIKPWTLIARSRAPAVIGEAACYGHKYRYSAGPYYKRGSGFGGAKLLPRTVPRPDHSRAYGTTRAPPRSGRDSDRS